jgi:hypothetical protein
MSGVLIPSELSIQRDSSATRGISDSLALFMYSKSSTVSGGIPGRDCSTTRVCGMPLDPGRVASSERTNTHGADGPCGGNARHGARSMMNPISRPLSSRVLHFLRPGRQDLHFPVSGPRLLRLSAQLAPTHSGPGCIGCKCAAFPVRFALLCGAWQGWRSACMRKGCSGLKSASGARTRDRQSRCSVHSSARSSGCNRKSYK